jgi:hypothetical protein
MFVRALLLGSIFALPYFFYLRQNGTPAFKDRVQETLWAEGFEQPELYGSGFPQCEPALYGVEFTAIRMYDQSVTNGFVCCGWSTCEIKY